MPLEPHKPAPAPVEPIYRLFTRLVEIGQLDHEHGLGGQLLFAGRIGLAAESSPGRQLLFAANIAGAASLAVSADPTAQREAIRDGVVDFMVTSLEEALRILKNEVRKRQAVSVGVALEPGAVVGAMLERGVLPDLLPPGEWPESVTGMTSAQNGQFVGQGSRPIPAENEPPHYVTWSVDRDFARWLPKLDALAQSIVPVQDTARQRWLRLAPRYLGRVAHRQHGVALTSDEAEKFKTLARQLLEQEAANGNPPFSCELSGESLTISER